MADILSSLFREPWSVDEFREAGARIMCQERLFNIREAISRKDDTLPPRLLKESKPDGSTKGVVVPLQEINEDFYKMVAYDLSTNNHPDWLLARLGIEKWKKSHVLA